MKVAIIAKSSDKAREVFRNSSLLGKFDFHYVGTGKKALEIEGVEAILDYGDSYEHRQYNLIHDTLVERFPAAPIFFDWKEML